MTHITRRAERQVEKLLRGLSPLDRERLVSALLQSVPYSLCGIITHREKHRLFHFRTRCKAGIRVCYARSRGADVVILDVAPHDHFEEFANNFTGSFGTYVPIKESRIMTQHATNGTAPRGPAGRQASQACTPRNPSGRSGIRALGPGRNGVARPLAPRFAGLRGAENGDRRPHREVYGRCS
jgi:hypothetical protein